MTDRVIIHADLNTFYASVEILHNPKLQGLPVAVGGSSEDRHGIILAKSNEAKACGVHVGQAVWEAKKQCPKLVIVPPHFEDYLRFSKMFRDILMDYSDQVEFLGIDGSWVDVTGSTHLFGTGEEIANTIRERVKKELGITASAGVSFNKIFAKLGSDMKNPNTATVITKENFKDITWPLPASELFGVGRATQATLLRYRIKTIGAIAMVEPAMLKRWFGSRGLLLHSHANGIDYSGVRSVDDSAPMVKSVGNSTTCPRDLENEEDARVVFQHLAESVSERMRELGLCAKTLQISLRTSDLLWRELQTGLSYPSIISSELTDSAMKLLHDNFNWEKPLRSVGLRGANLVPIGNARQLSMFGNEAERERLEKMEYAIDSIRQRFGHNSISRALLLSNANSAVATEHFINPFGTSFKYN